MGKIKFFIIFLFLGTLLFGQKQQKGFLASIVFVLLYCISKCNLKTAMEGELNV